MALTVLALVVGSVAVVGYAVCLMLLLAFQDDEESTDSGSGARATTSAAPPFPRVAARASAPDVDQQQPLEI